MKNIKLVGAILPVFTIGLAHASEVEANRVSLNGPFIEICRNGQPYLVPLVPHLNIGGHKILPHVEEENSIKGVFWEPGDEPLETFAFTFNSYGPGLSEFPLLNVLLGRESDYKISQLKVGTRAAWMADVWSELTPSLEVSSKGVLKIVPNDLQLFGRPIKVRCHPRLPVFSDDPNTHFCQVQSSDEANGAENFLFSTGSDLTGHWPLAFGESGDIDLSGWVVPLTEIEEIVNTIKSNGVGTVNCN